MNKISYQILATIIVYCVFPYISMANASNDSIYYNLVGKADTAIANNDWSGAETLLLSALQCQPTNQSNVLLISNLAIIRYQQGKDSLALATINHAHSIAPNSVTILSNRAKILKAMHRIDDAYNDYQRIIELDSTLIEPWYYHGLIALSNGNIHTAQNDFLHLEQLAPNDALTLEAMAMLHFNTHQYEQAIPYYTKLINQSPAADFYIMRITCYLILKRLSDASADINDALKLYPLEGELYLLRSWLNRQYYQHKEADADAQKAIELGISPEIIASIPK